MLQTPSVAPPVSRIGLEGAATPQVDVAVKEAPLVVSIEGNIGVGKSTLLRALKERYAKDDTVCFVDEPVATWEQHGLLAASGPDPSRARSTRSPPFSALVTPPAFCSLALLA